MSGLSSPCTYWCTLCDVVTTGPENYVAHLQGKAHAKKLAQQQAPQLQQTPLPSAQEVLEMCDVCDMPLNGALQAQQHYSGQKHQKKLQQAFLLSGKRRETEIMVDRLAGNMESSVNIVEKPLSKNVDVCESDEAFIIAADSVRAAEDMSVRRAYAGGGDNEIDVTELVEEAMFGNPDVTNISEKIKKHLMETRDAYRSALALVTEKDEMADDGHMERGKEEIGEENKKGEEKRKEKPINPVEKWTQLLLTSDMEQRMEEEIYGLCLVKNLEAEEKRKIMEKNIKV